MTSTNRKSILAGAVALALGIPAMAQQPSLPDPKVKPKRPTSYQVQPRKDKTQVHTSVNVPINTTQRAKFDIHAIKLHGVELRKPRMRGRMLRADDLTFQVVLQNAGSNTFAFSGNQIDASIIEGHFDYRQRVKIDRRRVPYYPARGMFDIAIRPNGNIELPLVVRGQKTKRVAFWPVPTPFKRGPGVKAIQLESGNAPIQIRPDVWYTIDANLKPAEDDEIDFQHSVFINLRFDREGGIAELQGPYLY